MSIEISDRDFLDLVHWARRYADQRMTGVPSDFNRIYTQLCKDNGKVMIEERADPTNPNWPYARDGMGEKYE